MNDYSMIIEDSANCFYAVRELADPALAHCFYGIEVKRAAGKFVPKAGSRGAKARLVRRECTKIIAKL